jgi:hypothetical protein
MIDDMQGLFSHASEAHRAGQIYGRDELFKAVLTSLGRLSATYEKGGNVEGFRAAEAACGVLRTINEKLGVPKHDEVPG